MQSAKLNPRQSKFLRMYTGRDADLYGNATACYKKVYGATDDRIAQVSGSRLLHHPRIAAILAQAEQAAIDRLHVNAEFVLNETVRLYDRSMADEPVAVESSHLDHDTGLRVITITDQLRYDPGTARQCLEMIGRHKAVQAFQDTVEHSHVHYLEAALMKRSKVIEGRAQVLLDNTGPGPGTDRIPSEANGSSEAQAPGPAAGADREADRPTPGTEKEKRSLSPEVKRIHAKESRDPASEREGATAL